MNSVPTLAELDCAAVLAVDIDAVLRGEAPVPDAPAPHGGAADGVVLGSPPARPEWVQDRERRKKRTKRLIEDKVINQDLSIDMNRGTFVRPKAKWATTAFELTDNQIYRLFELRLHYGHPADLCFSMFRLQPTDDDREQITWTCELYLRAWLAHLAAWYMVPEGTLAEVLADFRKQFAERDPVRARFYALCEHGGRSPEYAAAERAVMDLRRQENIEGKRKLGMSEEQIQKWMDSADIYDQRQAH